MGLTIAVLFEIAPMALRSWVRVALTGSRALTKAGAKPGGPANRQFS